MCTSSGPHTVDLIGRIVDRADHDVRLKSALPAAVPTRPHAERAVLCGQIGEAASGLHAHDVDRSSAGFGYRRLAVARHCSQGDGRLFREFLAPLRSRFLHRAGQESISCLRSA